MTLKSILSIIKRERAIPQRSVADIRASEALKSQLQTALNVDIVKIAIRALRAEMPVGAPSPISNNDQFAYYLGQVQGRKDAFDALESLSNSAMEEPKSDFSEASV